eukprot:CAMPEP_0206422068 /NCGR_PEP_ID=MMETSP0324_2-20121206/1851_1 /ASSEMBLY_ACC=CAM_ASM_000836 /TAXON_ID=2866 /ORGANISM="Crypthecodinium cohnii, Strain Seligo" /LENGTH=236 /DNA_ID=CAMNT_0053886339 /DNA_START=18 /DNA_END=725 /DNA_ORIENTATION=+
MWANKIVARLASGEAPADDCGLVLVCSWPMPQEVLQAYEHLRDELRDVMPDGAYIYPASTLHCTVTTLRAFTAGPMDAELRETMRSLWMPVLNAARAMEEWPSVPFKLRINHPTLEGAAGIFRYDDLDGAVESMRSCLRKAIEAAGGKAAEGMDWSEAKALPGTPDGQIAPQIPNIVHSTVLRWSSEPPDQAAAKESFAKVAEKWTPLDIEVGRATAVFEDHPYMHLGTDGEKNIW